MAAWRARVLAAETLGGARLVELELEDSAQSAGGPLGFAGGQYVIVDSGEKLPDGRAAKRAYSILSPDAAQTRLTLAALGVGGPGSRYLHRLQPGDPVAFSGPWGKLLPDDARPRPTWVIATDTGITAALGLCRGAAFRPQLPRARLVWLRERDGAFLPDAFVRALAPFSILPLPPVGRVGRAAALLAHLEGWLAEERPERVFASGDGALFPSLRARLAASGLPDDVVRAESFFHHPQREAGRETGKTRA